ncbi:peptidylprolyl isomerase [Jannaschia sp. W003]|uniref:peptidylprolyl isomerase n=1 Tax=Jannaschia sp. W003 TaxID=2867012 RepID=UPI0021A76D4A|nr:peptidylprolyl isomerase [Jannaschia sp. W003]UWQ21954.1 peptidylprolyl isomerase [Jannaschia sp. W003]
MRPLLLAAALLAPLPAAAQDASTVLARVNGTEITLGHLVAMRARLPEQYRQLPDEVLYQGMLDQIVQQQVLADAARADIGRADELGLENETRAFLAGRMLERAATQPLDEAAVQAAYEERYASAEAAPEWNASHILVETETEARALKAQLDDGADFAELARSESTGPSGPNGGELGWFGTGQMVPVFEAAVAELEPGEVSDPVESQFGWHVVKLNETRLKEAPALEEVRPQIEQSLREAAVDAEIARLTDGAEVERPEVEVDPALIRDDALLD